MPIIKEILNETEQVQQDWQAKGQRIRTFIVTGTDVDAALVALQNEPPPVGPVKQDKQHPRDTSLICDDIQAGPNGNGHVIVRAYYSNDRRFGSPRVPNREIPASLYSWGWEQRDVEVNLPIQLLAKKIIGEGETEQTVSVWTLTQPLKRRERRLVRPLKTKVAVANVAQLDEIALQAMTLHNIANKIYLFTGGDVRQIDDFNYEVVYRWEIDNGTPTPPIPPLPFPGPPAPDKIRFISQNPIDNNPDLLLREPYSRVEPIPPDNPRADSPGGGLWAGRFVYPYGLPSNASDGWRRLPGVPNLG